MNQIAHHPASPNWSRGKALLIEAHRAQSIFQRAFRTIIDAGISPEIAEAAFPAYAHRNPLINWIFWGRLRRAFWLFPGKALTLLDFGCGSGICSYVAANCGMAVTALDLNLAPQQLVARQVAFPKEIQFSAADVSRIASEGRKFDAIIALDVLEHVPAFAETLKVLLDLLEPSGALIISLPTETAFYRIGRKLAGREFTGDYHRARAGDIERELRRLAIVDYAAQHPPIVGLFRLLRARPRPVLA